MRRKERSAAACGCMRQKICERRSAQREMTLAELPVGTSATILKVMPHWRGRKKFADVGIVPGTELLMEAHAPFGGLMRVRVMETSMALHRDDAAHVMMRRMEPAE